MDNSSKFPENLLTFTTNNEKILFQLMDKSHLTQVEVLGREAWYKICSKNNILRGDHFADRLINLKEQMRYFDSGCWVAHNEKGDLIAYMISNPFQVRDMPLDQGKTAKSSFTFKEYKNTLSENQLRESIYLVHDIVVTKSMRNSGIHKHLHKLSVVEANNRNLTKIYAVALTWSFRKANKKYRYQLLCKARFHEIDSFVVVRDLSLE
jgi:hypothetical protein